MTNPSNKVAPVIRAALDRGPLVPDRTHLRFGRRLFSHTTANAAIKAGEARRLSNGMVIAMSATICGDCEIRYLAADGTCECRAHHA